MEWLNTEEDEMQDVGFEREMYEADYIREHVREMPEMGIRQVMQELKRYCEHRPNCTDCPIQGELCDGNLPQAHRIIEVKPEHEEEMSSNRYYGGIGQVHGQSGNQPPMGKSRSMEVKQ